MEEKISDKTLVTNSLSRNPDIQIIQEEPARGDVALGYLKGVVTEDEDLVIDKAATARVLRKIDMVILPVMA